MKKALPFVGMVMAEVAQVGLMEVGKEAMNNGMSSLVFVLYSNALASLILLPCSFLFHRSDRPPVTFRLLCGFFLLGVLGCFAQVFGYAGINLSSPTLGTTMLNLIPAITFLLAIIFRMEKLEWRSSSSLAKFIGTLASVSGAFIVTLYKGPPILRTSLHLNLPLQLYSQQSNWVIGGLLLTADCVMASAFLIVQALILKKYPAELTVVFYYCFFVAIQSAIISLIMERDPSAWSLKPNMRLFAVLYSAVFGSVFQLGVSTWCLHRTGPLFVAMFKPIGIVVAVAIGIMFLGDGFYLGSFVGAIVIVTGFYFVMWGKAKEQKMGEDNGVRSLESKSEGAFLLQNYIEETEGFVR
ncbi:WAT1-related protein At3g28050-like [Malania oleifera]|uniref:WAT1-related protein At3g28050-like n=1 Tax=Malania oleifera TaxID=397392 RepID=UPI0025ADF6BC|nr:WAT1-related protein At3g28050-like [Malania oleifera]